MPKGKPGMPTPPEPINNMGLICDQHAVERHRSWQQNNPKTVIRPHDYIKVDFSRDDHHEHMWLEVQSVAGNQITGRLDNDPIVSTNLKYNSIVTVDRDAVEDWIAGESTTTR